MKRKKDDENVVDRWKTLFLEPTNMVTKLNCDSLRAQMENEHHNVVNDKNQDVSGVMLMPVNHVVQESCSASSSQVKLTDAKMNERAKKLAAARTNQDPSFQERPRTLAAENSDINDEDDSE